MSCCADSGSPPPPPFREISETGELNIEPMNPAILRPTSQRRLLQSREAEFLSDFAVEICRYAGDLGYAASDNILGCTGDGWRAAVSSSATSESVVVAYTVNFDSTAVQVEVNDLMRVLRAASYKDILSAAFLAKWVINLSGDQLPPSPPEPPPLDIPPPPSVSHATATDSTDFNT